MITTFLVFEIVTKSPMLLANPDAEDAFADRPATLDDANQLYVPPSSLAGSLRAHLKRRMTEPVEKATMGSRLGDHHREDGTSLDPSHLRFLGSESTLEGEPVGVDQLQVVESTAIDRHRGAARSKTLRSAETAPPGVTVTLFAEFAGSISSETLEHLASWQPSLGGSRTSGLGRAELVSLRCGQLDWTDPELVVAAVEKSGRDLVRFFAKQDVTVTGQDRPPFIMTTWSIVDGLHIGGRRRSKGDRNFTDVHRRRAGDEEVPYIEGSSLKGVLRSRCEYIERSIRSDDKTPTSDRLFGTVDRAGRIQVAGTTIDDCYFDDQPHVGIDRFTGGAAPGLLWTDRVVTRGELTISIYGDEAEVGDAGLALLRAALRDMADGYVGIGGQTARGLGTIQLEHGTDLDNALPLEKTALETLRSAA